MPAVPPSKNDPVIWCSVLALLFGALCAWRIAIPSQPYFDEVHYLRAARVLLMLEPANREHPMFAKEVIAASIAVFADQPLAWRLPAMLAGTAGFFAFSRLVWHASGNRIAAILAALLLITNFSWFVQSRIAMLDIFAASLTIVSLWQFAAAIHARGRLATIRLAVSGAAMGLAMASKWSAVPMAAMPAIGFLVWRGRFADIGMFKAALLLGLLPLVIYWITFVPAMLYAEGAVEPLGWIAAHRDMVALQESVRSAHPYASGWTDWVVNRRPIWYFYSVSDGAQRGIVMLGNPLTMLAGLPALIWCGWQAIARARSDAAAFVVLYAAALSPWLLPTKPVQFYYYYLLPGAMLMGCLALWLAAMWDKRGWPRTAAAILTASAAALFAWFYPILSAAPLNGERAFTTWMWLDSWR